MSLDSLVAEIRSRTEAEIARIAAATDSEEARIVADRDQRIATFHEESVRATDQEVARLRTQRLAAAKVSARKQLYESRERWLQTGLDATRQLLSDYTKSDRYGATLRKMVTLATDELGKQARISGRAEDAAALSKAAGKLFDPTPRPILGGIVAETSDGRRRLNLSLDELFRLREDPLRAALAK